MANDDNNPSTNNNPDAHDKDKPKERTKDTREACTFLPGAGGKIPAVIHERSRADVNVAELETRDGKRVASVPRWNGQGPRPPFDCWQAS